MYCMSVCVSMFRQTLSMFNTNNINFLELNYYFNACLCIDHQGVLEGIWITLVVMFGYSGGSGADLGATPSNLMYGNTCFTIATISVNLKMLFIQHRWHWFEPIVLIGSTILMYVYTTMSVFT